MEKVEEFKRVLETVSKYKQLMIKETTNIEIARHNNILQARVEFKKGEPFNMEKAKVNGKAMKAKILIIEKHVEDCINELSSVDEDILKNIFNQFISEIIHIKYFSFI